jgi:hypothetical protein
MAVITIKALANELGLTYWQVRHVIRSKFVTVKRLPHQRKAYLTPGEAAAIKAFFGVVDPKQDRYCRR